MITPLGQAVKDALRERGWKYERLFREMQRAGMPAGVTLDSVRRLSGRTEFRFADRYEPMAWACKVLEISPEEIGRAFLQPAA
jgi:hypothetical protein